MFIIKVFILGLYLTRLRSHTPLWNAWSTGRERQPFKGAGDTYLRMPSSANILRQHTGTIRTAWHSLDRLLRSRWNYNFIQHFWIASDQIISNFSISWNLWTLKVAQLLTSMPKYTATLDQRVCPYSEYPNYNTYIYRCTGKCLYYSSCLQQILLNKPTHVHLG